MKTVGVFTQPRPRRLGKTPVRLREAQIYVGPTGLTEPQRMRAEHASFAVAETMRLWLKEHNVDAPFRKLLVLIHGEQTHASTIGQVTVTLGVCQVRVGVAPDALRTGTDDLRWIVRCVMNALSFVQQNAEWSSPLLEVFVRQLYLSRGPFVHFFPSLVRRHVALQTTCSPWISFELGRTRIGVDVVSTGAQARNIVLIDKLGPLSVDQDFPVADAVLRGPSYLLLDAKHHELAAIPLELDS